MMTATTVRQGGKIRFRGRIFEDDTLRRKVGDQVLVMRDKSINEADCIVFSLDNEHICNAQNKRRWAALVA